MKWISAKVVKTARRLTKLAESRIPSSTGWVRSRVNFHAAPFLDFLPAGLFILICDHVSHVNFTRTRVN